MLGAVVQLSAHELAARARAAIVYAGLEYKEIGDALNYERTTFARKLRRKGSDFKSTLSQRDIDYIIERTGVGVEWFTADFSRLGEIPLPRPVADVAGEAGRLRDGTSQRPRERGDDHPDSGQAA